MALKIKKEKHLTAAEYLAFEENAEFRNEFDSGTIIAMPGGSFNHARIINNVDRLLAERLNENCQSITNDLKVGIEKQNKFYYPDLLVICGEPKFQRKRDDTIENPVLIIEVLSKSTEARDRGEKMLGYRGLDSLKEYVLISQDKAIVEQYSKDGTGNWIHKATIGIQSKVFLESIEVELTLEEIYKKIKL